MNDTAEHSTAPRFERRIFDESERARIRAALFRHKDREGLSMSKFADAVGAANGRKAGMISRRTLERFLTGKFRVDDDFVNYCDIFLRTEKPPPPYEVMGDALAAFIGDDERDWHGVPFWKRRPDLPIYGRYVCYASDGTRRFINPETGEMDEENPRYDIPYSVLDLEPLQGTGYVKVRERVFNLERMPREDLKNTLNSRAVPPDDMIEVVLDGVLVFCRASWQYAIILRADGQYPNPKFYLLDVPAMPSPEAEETIRRRSMPLLGFCAVSAGAALSSRFSRGGFRVSFVAFKEPDWKHPGVWNL